MLTKFSERGAKFSSLSGVLVQKHAFQKGDGSHPLFSIFCYGGCWWMLVLDSKKGMAKNYTTRVVLPPPLEKEDKGEKKREARGQKTPPFLHCFWALKTGRK